MSAGKILESSDNLLIEILVLLPPKSIFRFMCVSKRWKYIINNPFFRRRYSQRRRSCTAGCRLLALIQKTMVPLCRQTYGYRHQTSILPVYTQCNHRSIKYKPTISYGRFINSSNGLILCRSNPTTYHVVNPVAEKAVSLPPPCYYNYGASAGLMCQENTTELRANYLVIQARQHESFDSVLQIQTYSSKTGQWVVSMLAATGVFKLLNQPPMVANGVFHWFALLSTVVNHKKLISLGLAVHVPNNDDVQLIQLPDDVYSMKRIGRSPDHVLWLVKTESDSINLWILPKKGEDGSYRAKEEWEFVYFISCESVRTALKLLNIECRSHFSFEAFVSWDPLVVLLNIDEKILFLYNAESNSGEMVMVRYHGTLVFSEFVFPYMESSCLSSYAL